MSRHPVARAAFVGSKRIGLRALQALIDNVGDALVGAVTIDDRGDPRSAFDDLIEQCRRSRIHVDVVADRAAQDRAIDRLDPDVVLVAGWYWIISERILSGRTFVGIHHSLLPAYRGGSPLVWAMIRGEHTVGTTLFRLEGGVDSGPIYGQATVQVHDSDTIADVAERLETAATSLLTELVPAILAGTAIAAPQLEAGATYVVQRKPDDGVIDWSSTAREIHDFVRAQSEPYPGAFTHINGDRLTVWRTSPTSIRSPMQPGSIVAEGVVCGDGVVLALLDVQLHEHRGQLDRVIAARWLADGRGSVAQTSRLGEPGR